jgi:glycosyltransferase involved in cell wall biosynthesis
MNMLSEKANKTPPLVSIVLPTHNRPEVLEFAIRSALYQTLGDFELWVVGDGCTDHTETLVKSFNDPRIIWLDLPKAPGVGYENRNVALRQANGRYIAYLGHDDLWLCDHLELLINHFEKTEKEFIYSRSVTVIPDGIMLPLSFNLNNPSCLNDFVNYRDGLNLSTVMHLRDCLEKYGYWNGSIRSLGDNELYLRIFRGGSYNNFSVYPLPTAIRFRALWHGRDSRWWRRPKLDIMHKFNMLAPFLPEKLRFEVPPSQTEQEALWHIMSQDPPQWAFEFREAVHQWMDSRLYDLEQFFPLILAKTGSWLRERIKPSRWSIADDERYRAGLK